LETTNFTSNPAVILADYPAFKARFRELDADKFDELSQAAEL